MTEYPENCVMCINCIFKKKGACWYQVCVAQRWYDDCPKLEYSDRENFELYNMFCEVVGSEEAAEQLFKMYVPEFEFITEDEEIENITEHCKRLMKGYLGKIKELKENNNQFCSELGELHNLAWFELIDNKDNKYFDEEIRKTYIKRFYNFFLNDV